jgi:alpha-beta hydrolase superfamily lysophospholipase
MDLSHKFLQSNGYSESKIQEYYHWLEKLRKRIHPHSKLAPTPKESYLVFPDKTKIFMQEFIPEGCQTIILCQHGNCIQSDLFYPLADHLFKHNIGLIAVDNLGHGRSGPSRGYFNHPERIFPAYEAILKRYPDMNWYIHGESLGCIMFSWFLTQRKRNTPKIKSFILQVPPFRLRGEIWLRPLLPIARYLVYLLRLMSWDRPFVHFKPDFNNPYFYEFHKIDQIDPIRAPKFGAAHLQSDIILFQMFPSLIKNLRIPLLILQGTHDSILDPNGALTLQRIAKDSPLRRVRLFQNSDHSLFNDKYAQSIYDEILTWIQRINQKYSK